MSPLRPEHTAGRRRGRCSGRDQSSGARAAAAEALALARELKRGPVTEADAIEAAQQAGPAARAHLADAKAEALAAKYTPAYAKTYAKSYMKKHYGWGEAEYQAVVEM